jgi:vancomycin resistance protein VanW
LRQPFTSRHPALYRLRVLQRQALRALRWHFGPERFAITRLDTPLPHKIYRHQSKLRRLHSNDPQEALWQDNKVHNHSLALPHLHNILIRPGETLSLWRLIGRPSAARGYKTGMELHLGRARGGIGGGLCQIANLVHWLALHTPMTVTLRASHSFDPFPDQGRVIPYGTGAALFYNYIDLWLFNPTTTTFQLRLWLTDTLINGEIRADAPLPHRYRISARAEGFSHQGDSWFRHNEIWRETIAKGQEAAVLKAEKLYENHVRVMYQPPD